MKRSTLGLVAVALGVLAIAPAQAAAPKLVGTVGPGYTIKLTQGGRKVTKLKAGTYTFVISDKSSFHSYGLDGPKGFEKDFTSVPFKGTKTFSVKLKTGKYKFYCSAHESSMFGFFTGT
jgi:plastocyanin